MLTDINNITPERRAFWTIRLHETEGFQIETHYPYEFIESTRPKYVVVHKANLFVVDENQIFTPQHISFCASFNQDECFNNDNESKFICMCNQELNQPKSYKQHTPQQSFRMWLVDETLGEALNFSEADDHIVLELELVY